MRRPSISTDNQAIKTLLTECFYPSEYEAKLRELIVDNTRFYEWVHVDDSLVVGHILYSPATKDGKHIGYHLAPITVHPDYRLMGIASQLLEESLNSPVLKDEAIFVLGDPSFYEKFGFRPTHSAKCPFDDGNKHFRVLRWQDTGDTFQIGYHPAFIQAGEHTTVESV